MAPTKNLRSKKLLCKAGPQLDETCPLQLTERGLSSRFAFKGGCSAAGVLLEQGVVLEQGAGQSKPKQISIWKKILVKGQSSY